MAWNNSVLNVRKTSSVKLSELASCWVDLNNLLISLVEIGLYKLSLFSGISFGKLYFPRKLPIFLFSGVIFGKSFFLIYCPFHQDFSFIYIGLYYGLSLYVSISYVCKTWKVAPLSYLFVEC